jgi:glycosyltransferase involved in cell wall biosynthesis
MKRILHVITTLEVGGAEMMLYKLVRALAARGYQQKVIALTTAGRVADLIRDCGVEAEALGLRYRALDLGRAFGLKRKVAAESPDVVHTWMYHADLLGGIAARSAKVERVVWSIRQSSLDRRSHRPLTMAVIRTCARLSRRVPDRIICGSEAAQKSHIAFGYDQSKLVVIPNGFDMDEFRPDAKAKSRLLAELGLPSDVLLLGHVGRYHPQKDHPNLFAAASTVLRARPEAHLVLCGLGVDSGNDELRRLAEASGASERVHMFGPRSDVAKLMAGFDLVVSSSKGEGFPNVIGEAMACGVPCVVTDVGDSAVIVGDTGWVVPPRESGALAVAILESLGEGEEARQNRGVRARQRIADSYSISAIAARYTELYEGRA